MTDGWEIFNIENRPYVDHVGNAKDLSRFADNTFTQIYASHVLEHFDHMNEIVSVLKEWYRVLKPGGRLFVSVPDLDTLAGLLISNEKLESSERFMVMRMIMGGHLNEFDYHRVGLNEEFLSLYLQSAGYVKLRRVQEFGLFKDTSCIEYCGVLISLNMIAEKRPQVVQEPLPLILTHTPRQGRLKKIAPTSPPIKTSHLDATSGFKESRGKKSGNT